VLGAISVMGQKKTHRVCDPTFPLNSNGTSNLAKRFRFQRNVRLLADFRRETTLA